MCRMNCTLMMEELSRSHIGLALGRVVDGRVASLEDVPEHLTVTSTDDVTDKRRASRGEASLEEGLGC